MTLETYAYDGDFPNRIESYIILLVFAGLSAVFMAVYVVMKVYDYLRPSRMNPTFSPSVR